MTLHTLNKAFASSTTAATCLEQLQTTDTLLLLEDGVFCLLDEAFMRRISPCLQAGTRICALGDDLAARGISDRIPAAAKVIGYKDFVALSLHHERLVNWV